MTIILGVGRKTDLPSILFPPPSILLVVYVRHPGFLVQNPTHPQTDPSHYRVTQLITESGDEGQKCTQLNPLRGVILGGLLSLYDTR